MYYICCEINFNDLMENNITYAKSQCYFIYYYFIVFRSNFKLIVKLGLSLFYCYIFSI